jgi:protein-S-isoprenylcysteine O-methyltransferase Ste14
MAVAALIAPSARPVLIAVYYRRARREESEAEARFGEAYREYKSRVPMFVPRLWARLEPRWSER